MGINFFLSSQSLVIDSINVLRDAYDIPQEEIDQLKRDDFSNVRQAKEAQQDLQLQFQEQAQYEGKSNFYALGMTAVKGIEGQGFVSVAARLASHLNKGEEEEQAKLTSAKEKIANIATEISQIKEELGGAIREMAASIIRDTSEIKEDLGGPIKEMAAVPNQLGGSNVVNSEARSSVHRKLIDHCNKVVQLSEKNLNGQIQIDMPIAKNSQKGDLGERLLPKFTELFDSIKITECKACKLCEETVFKTNSDKSCCWWASSKQCSVHDDCTDSHLWSFVKSHELLLSGLTQE